MGAEEGGDCLFVSIALRDAPHELFVRLLGSGDFDRVEFEEDDGGDCADSFVAINKRMVLDDVEQIGGGHFEKIRVQVPATKRRTGLGDCRLQKPEITNSPRAAVAGNLVAMDFHKLIER